MHPTISASRVNLSWRHILESRFGEELFTAREAQQSDIGHSRLTRLLASGLVVKGTRGLYRLKDQPSEVVARSQEALKAVPGSVIARRTSAWLVGEDTRTPGEATEPVPIECIVPRGRNPSRIQGIRCYQAELTAEDIIEMSGLRCTAPARTAADLLRWVAPHMALACVDQMVRGELVTPGECLAVLHRFPGERNVHRARELTASIDRRSESYGESWLRLRLLEAGFPRPESQIPVLDDHGRVVYRLDLGWPRRRIAVEYDGEEFHSGRRAEAADARRREDLRTRFGWVVIGVGRGEVLGTSLALERGVGELLGLAPTITRRIW
jgi:very-short-patch-repair endonuclease